MSVAGGPQRLEHLDGLRGVASVAVILHHAMLALHPAWANYHTHYLSPLTLPFAPVAMFWQGNVAVCVFFALSGYVLLPMALRPQAAFAGLVARRVIRLGLPILAALLFGYALWKLDLYCNIPAARIAGTTGWWDYLYVGQPKLWSVLRDTLKMPFAPSKSAYDAVVWTMHWEYLGSFGIFLIYRLFRSRRLRIVAMLAVLCATFNDYYFDFAAGALLFDLDIAGHAARLNSLSRRILAGSLLIVFAWFGCNTWSDGPGTPYAWLDWLPNLISGPHAEKSHQISAVFLLAALLVSPSLQRTFSCRPALALGRLSFASYLLHLPILCSLGAALVIALTPGWGLIAAASAAVGAVIAATYLLSVPFTNRIDVSATRLSRQVGRFVESAWNRHCTVHVGKIWHLVPHGRAS